MLYPRLDISSRDSIKAFAGEVKQYHGDVDVLINNAGINVDAQYGYENARKTLDVNYRGTLEVRFDLFRIICRSSLALHRLLEHHRQGPITTSERS